MFRGSEVQRFAGRARTYVSLEKNGSHVGGWWWRWWVEGMREIDV